MVEAAGLKLSLMNRFLSLQIKIVSHQKEENKMANIVRKPNGTYLIRISAGKDDRGKPVTVSRTFAPERNEPFYRKSSGADFGRRNSGCERAENRTKLSRQNAVSGFLRKIFGDQGKRDSPRYSCLLSSDHSNTSDSDLRHDANVDIFVRSIAGRRIFSKEISSFSFFIARKA